MSELALKISPVIIVFIVGVVVRHFGLLEKRHADIMLRLVVRIGLPALIFASISRIPLSFELSYLPLAASLTLILTWPLVLLTGRAMQLPRVTLGSFVIGPMIMNMAFMFPFVIVAWGAEGFALAALFDFGNGIIVLTLVYALSCWYGADETRWLDVLKKMVTFPPFIALFLALVINILHMPVPEMLADGIHVVGRYVILLVPLALGMYFNPRITDTGAVFSAVAIRIGVGLLFGFLWVELFELEGLMRSVVLLCCAAPVGFNVLVFAAEHHLNKEFAASIASISLMLGLIYIPAMIYLLG